jgi:hypothetical protein
MLIQIIKSFIKGPRRFEETLIEIALSISTISSTVLVVLVRTLDVEDFLDAIIFPLVIVVIWTVLL